MSDMKSFQLYKATRNPMYIPRQEGAWKKTKTWKIIT